MVLHIDLETYSDIDLKACGVYKYVESPEFKILLVSYAFDNEPVKVVDLAQGEKWPKALIKALDNPEVIKTSYNANFELTCLRKFFHTPVDQWRCSMIHSSYERRIGSLANVCEALKLPRDKQKDKNGLALIKLFSIPNAEGKRNLPEEYPEQWKMFKEYCRQDTEAERALGEKLQYYNWPGREQHFWELDQKINNNGVKIDMSLVNNALKIAEAQSTQLAEEYTRLTGIEKVNSRNELLDWLQTKGVNVESVSKGALTEIMQDDTLPEEVRNVLEIRSELAKSSIAKYTTMLNVANSDHRARGLFRFYGTGTGRWAGRLIQLQNLPRNDDFDGAELDKIREAAISGSLTKFKAYTDNVTGSLSQLIRTALVPSKGKKFVIVDFSAIEARVIAWLAGEVWRLEVFRGDGKIYEQSAALMYHVPVHTIAKGESNYHLRAVGKVAELACGFGGGIGALKAFGADKQGLDDDALKLLIDKWRLRSPKIVELWREYQTAAVKLTTDPRATLRKVGKVIFTKTVNSSDGSTALTITLPSSRKLFYPDPTFTKEEGLSFDDIKEGKLVRTRTYGGKITENVVQAIARDCLAEFMNRLDKLGFDIVMHVHDEVVLEVPEAAAEEKLKEALELMQVPPAWALDLPLKGAGFAADYYQK